MATDPETERDPFLDHLRHRVEGAELLPSPHVWAGISGKLPAPNPWLTRYVAGGVSLGVVVGLLIGWLASSPAAVVVPADAPRTVVAAAPLRPVVQPAASTSTITATERFTPPAAAVRIVTRTKVIRETIPGPAVLPPATPNVAAAPTAAIILTAPPAPAHQQTLPALWHSALVLDSTIQHESKPVQDESVAAATRRHAHLAVLAAEQQPVLLALHDHLNRLDSQTHAAVAATRPPSPADSLSALAPPTPTADSSRRSPLAPPRRWAALLLAETTNAWGSLPGYNPRTTEEKIFGANTRAVALEYRLPGRWRMQAGFGETQLRDQFRFTHDSLHHTAHHDTTWAFHTSVNITHDTTYTVRLDSLGRPEPIINQQGQVIGYHTVYEHFYDTTYQITTRHDTTRQMQESVHIREEYRNERRQQDLRPNYKFWTVPVAVQFDVIRRPRWSAGVSLGGQVLLFRGGYQPKRDPGTGTYVLRRIGATEGPFRPVSLALSTGLSIRYRLSDRLSLLAGGTARGWAVGPLRTGTLPRWTLGAHGGISWELGR